MEEIESLRSKLKQLQQEKDFLQQNNTSVHRELNAVKKELEAFKKENKSKQSSGRHSDEFWEDIGHKLRTDTDAIKELIKNGTITKDDHDNTTNLLHYAAHHGNYEIAKLCINKGYDLKAKIDDKWTALDYANFEGKHDIAQLLMLSEIEGNIGERIKEKAKILNRERGNMQNIINGLERIGKQTAKMWKDTTIEMMTNCIQNKECFDDIFLSLCYEFIGFADFEKSELFKAIIATSDDVIKNGNKTNWFWFKEVMLASNVMFECILFCLLRICA